MARFNRRVFMQRLTFFGGGVVLLGGCKKPSQEEVVSGKGPRRSLSEKQYATLRAAVDRLLPKDEDPGALDANVPEYIDRALLTPEIANLRSSFLDGLNLLDRRSRGRFHSAFADAEPEQRDALLTDFKNAADGTADARLYEILLTLTLEGFLGDPSYGGNRDYVGWKLVGFMTSGPGGTYDPQKHLHHHRSQ